MKFSSQRQIFRPKSNDEKSFPGKDIKKVWKNGIKFIYILWMVSVTEDQIFFSSKKKDNRRKNGIMWEMALFSWRQIKAAKTTLI